MSEYVVGIPDQVNVGWKRGDDFTTQVVVAMVEGCKSDEECVSCVPFRRIRLV